MPRTQVKGPSACLENLSTLVEYPLRIPRCGYPAEILASGSSYILFRTAAKSGAGGHKKILRHIVFA